MIARRVMHVPWPGVAAAVLLVGGFWIQFRPRAKDEPEAAFAKATMSQCDDHTQEPDFDEVEFAGTAAQLAARLGDRHEVEPMFPIDEPALAHWFRVPHAAANRLATIPGVTYVGAPPRIAAPHGPRDASARRGFTRCAEKTSSLVDAQAYLEAAPGCIDALAGWTHPGGRGEHIQLGVVSTSLARRHEDLPKDRIDLVGRGDASPETGATLGVVIAADNHVGMTGIAPAITRTTLSNASGTSLAEAVEAAVHNLRPGDVLLLDVDGESGATLGDTRRVPVEYWPSVFAVIKHATSRGVIVVEAAGDGGVDLDAPAFAGAFDRTRRDSGAILVGAGAPAVSSLARSRLPFSNFGRRVDVQGWGAQVASVGGGELQWCADPEADKLGGPEVAHKDRRDYTDVAGGSGVAAAMVAGAAAQISGAYREAHDAPIAPAVLRDLLVATGSPQVATPEALVAQHIGPLPDVKAALAAIDRR
ncbi:MAG: hypothetical protein K8W52_14655 [Deltaproteobacteria bacterium]|nr:hypothetical protein [Deltaproteobacteria bacterium]